MANDECKFMIKVLMGFLTSDTTRRIYFTLYIC